MRMEFAAPGLSQRIFKALAVMAAVWLAYGCVALQPLPTAARAGDTLTLAVGSADGMTTTNTSVEFFAPGVDPDVNPELGTPVPIQNVVKLLPDKTSHAWLGGEPRKIPRRSSHGGWLTVLAVDLPETLPQGDGILRVTTTSEVKYPRFSATPNGVDIPVTILAGTGSPNPFDYSVVDGSTLPGDLLEVESLPHAVIKPEVLPEGTQESESYGAIEMDVTVPITNLGGGSVLDEGIAVILDDQPQNINNQTNLIWKRTGDDFKIMLVSPVGMYSYQARVSIVPMFPEYLYQISGTPVLNSITYYDLNGVIDTSVPTATISLGP
jgi:hypothetical protein